MFGAYYYGFTHQKNVKADLKIAEVARWMDKNDFMFSNSPYSLIYERPKAENMLVTLWSCIRIRPPHQHCHCSHPQTQLQHLLE